MTCPGGSGAALEACCGPIIAGKRPAPTAAALMRSRYTAYATKQIDRVLATHDPETREEVDEAGTRSWAARTTWQSLEIVSTKDGGPEDEAGEVEFVARFQDERGRDLVHHERSTFVKREGRWY